MSVSPCRVPTSAAPAYLLLPDSASPVVRGLHLFLFQFNLSSAVHRVTQLNPECVLGLLKLRYNVNERKPLPVVAMVLKLSSVVSNTPMLNWKLGGK